MSQPRVVRAGIGSQLGRPMSPVEETTAANGPNTNADFASPDGQSTVSGADSKQNGGDGGNVAENERPDGNVVESVSDEEESGFVAGVEDQVVAQSEHPAISSEEEKIYNHGAVQGNDVSISVDGVILSGNCSLCKNCKLYIPRYA